MRASEWRCAGRALDVAATAVMGVLNVTPDSFSDGGRFFDAVAAVERGATMLVEGAVIVDVGGESTRPGAEQVHVAEELERVQHVVAALAASGACVSIDTRHAEVAAACVREGASIINDVSGFRDPSMLAVAAGCDAGLVVMHMQGEPGTMQDQPRYDDVVGEVCAYLDERVAALVDAGVAPERIALDVGIGFGKTLSHNLALLRGLERIAELGHPVVVGASRKRFIGEIAGADKPSARLGGSVAAAIFAASQGASFVRAHDVRETAQALVVWRRLAQGG